MKTFQKDITNLFRMLPVGLLLLLTACPTTQQQQTLTQIQSQLAVLSNEVRESFIKSEDDRLTLYKQLNEEIKLLQTNQADAVATSDELHSAITAIEAKLDEYNTRMEKLGERLSSTETALIDRIILLSEKVNELRGDSTSDSGSPSRQPLAPNLAPSRPLSPQESMNPEASQLYHTAYTAFINGKFDTAIAGFEKFLELYPNTELADMAQYWIAESFFSLGEYETALKEYDKLISQYPNSDKIPAAFYNKADAYLKLDRQIEAISHLKYVKNQFPDSAAARKAEERLRALGE